MPVQHRQSLPIPQHLNLQNILELRRQVVRRHARQQADRLLGLEKFSRGLLRPGEGGEDKSVLNLHS
jgi:hypothetical protein